MRKEVQRTGDIRTDEAAYAACRGDITSFCRRVVPGGGRLHRCLFENFDLLSRNCREKVSQIIKMIKAQSSRSSVWSNHPPLSLMIIPPLSPISSIRKSRTRS